MVLHAETPDAGKRLDRFLQEKLPEFSRSRLQEWVKDGRVQVNGHPEKKPSLVLRGGEEVHLTPKEYGVLAELARRPDRVLSHAQLLKAVWGPAHAERVEYLRIAVRGLRQKLEADPALPRLIVNELAVGYRLSLRNAKPD